ncbi:tripartite tricarboxylate transporter substrate binding protein [Hydrogenophaga sp.]|uniref:Bug family tripartite tricarboxylate transporter substrate binding protein n=1 Tax=Hydrogenophaga sp. TaxID=1904254 RepID=UPI002721D6A9|nr:tripartite tricarboxylate transporter substrate binding protein [Hydrogenophaga sp.]MDO9437042.1 tripartite tricarboxylate transporter substrate binding protein [Hydrogenophaga sp.]
MRALIFCALFLPAAVLAQYPNQPLKMVVGFGPGSTTDAIARTLATGLAAGLQQPVVVENKAGALSTIATDAVARSRPDGYTLLVGANSGMSTAPAGLVRNLRYDPLADFEPIGTMVQTPYILLVDPKLPVATADQLVTWMQQNPRRATCASGNANGRVYCEAFKRLRLADATSVPYKSTPDAITDVIGGQVSMVFLDLVSALPRIRAAQLKPLLIMTAERSALIADVPNKREAGYADFPTNYGWQALFAPARLPKPIQQRLNQALNKVLSTPDVRRQLEQSGFDVLTGSPDDLRTFLKRDLDAWRRLVKELDLQPEG